MNQLVPQDAPKQRQIIEVVDAVPLLDTSKFEHMQRIATGMARSTLIPDSLREEGTKDNKQELPFERVAANCFLIVNQAVRWGLDPFSVAQAVSVVHGKLCYEGKLVAAVIQAKLGFNLHHHFEGEGEAMRVYLSDKLLTDDIVATLKPGIRRTDMRLIDGSVSEWKTSGNGSPWSPKNFVRMLIYRGTRDWCRIYEPALMLGVYTPDEMLDMSDNARAVRAKEFSTPSVMQRLQQRQSDPQSGEGFSKDFVTSETDTLASGQNNNEQDTPADATSSGSVEGGERSVLSDSTLVNSGEDQIEETGNQPDVSEVVPDYEQRRECLDKFLGIATSEHPLSERRGILEQAKDCWKVDLPNDLEFVRLAFMEADNVIKGKVTEEGARENLSTFLVI